MPSPDPFVVDRASVGECPVVDEERGELVWVDIPAGRLRRDPLPGGDAPTVTATIAMSLGAVGLRAAGGYVVAVADGLGLLDGDATLDIVHPILPEPERRMNDAKCDPAGRWWAGSTTLDFRAGQGAVHCWDPHDGEVRTVLDGLTLPNGLGWSPDQGTFYLADTVRHQVLAASYDRDSGALGPPQALIHVETGAGAPDGLCIDEDGCLWIAMWGGAEVRRYAPTGHQLATVPMPVSQPSSCAFGQDGTLYITSAADGVDADREPLAGSVFALPTVYRGVPVSAFAG